MSEVQEPEATEATSKPDVRVAELSTVDTSAAAPVSTEGARTRQPGKRVHNMVLTAAGAAAFLFAAASGANYEAETSNGMDTKAAAAEAEAKAAARKQEKEQKEEAARIEKHKQELTTAWNNATSSRFANDIEKYLGEVEAILKEEKKLTLEDAGSGATNEALKALWTEVATQYMNSAKVSPTVESAERTLQKVKDVCAKAGCTPEDVGDTPEAEEGIFWRLAKKGVEDVMHFSKSGLPPFMMTGLKDQVEKATKHLGLKGIDSLDLNGDEREEFGLNK
jgi:hypothetical protein